MGDLTIGLIGALLATNQPQAVSNVIQQHTGVAVDIAADPVEQALRVVMMGDDAAQDDVTGWLRAYDAQTNRTPATDAEMNRRIAARFDQVRDAYANFLRNHPESAHGYLAFGSFLNDIGDEEGAHVQYENSLQLDPKNPAVWNNLANYYGEFSPVQKAFEYYEKAIQLKPDEPVYWQNFATTVFLFRKDAREHYHLEEPQVFDKALGLYRRAMALAPGNFVLACDYAESYYGIKPLRTNDALAAWTNAMNTAHTDAERQGVEVHLARVNIAAGFFQEASNCLNAVTNPVYAELKNRLWRSLADHQHPDTNAVADTATNNIVAAVPPLDLAPAAGTNAVPDLSSNLMAAPPAIRRQLPK